MKSPVFIGGFALAGLLLSDAPRWQVPTMWQHSLSGGGTFHIERRGDLTLKYVTVPAGEGALELIPVPSPGLAVDRVRSVEQIASAFSGETHRAVLAAVNGGFFDMATGLPIGFLLRDGDMEFFNMPQGFARSMVGFGHGVSIISPKQMPKAFLRTRAGILSVHHINVPGGANAFGVFTPRYQRLLKRPPNATYLLARHDGHTPQRYRIESVIHENFFHIPAGCAVIALHGVSQKYAQALPLGAIVRLGWALPPRWEHEKIVHGLLAGPRLLERGRLHVTAEEERLAKLKSPDRVALGVKPNGEAILLWAHHETARNLDFTEVAALLAGLGASEAIALDGGHSRALLAQTQTASLTDRYYEGGRPVANALLVALRRPNS